MKVAKHRRLDTRRKVVLGGAVIALAREGRVEPKFVLQMIATMSDRDQALFEDWVP